MIAIKWVSLALVGASLASCASTSVMPLSADTFQITAQGDPDCGPTGAQKVAFHRAAVETIRQGYDRFMIVQAYAANNIRVVGQTPIEAHTTQSAVAMQNGNAAFVTGQSNTYYTGGQPIMGGTADQNLTVRMFRDGDPAGQSAIAARSVLGPDWQREVQKGSDSSIC